MKKPLIDPAIVDFERCLYVQMESDYTTDSNNLGERTYFADYIYRVDRNMLTEIEGKRVGHRFTQQHVVRDPETGVMSFPVARRVYRPQIAVISKVTRWFTANGEDTHFLSVDKVSRVPSNLAAWLIQAQLAVAA